MRGGHDRPRRERQRDGTEPIKKGVCGNAWTPGGVFEFYRKVEGNRESRLGGMLNPVYFNYGIAVHGAYKVPLTRRRTAASASRTRSRARSSDLVNIGEQVFVWDGVEEPEAYGAQSGLWDWADPNYTTTTTSHDDHDAPPTTVGPTTTAAAAGAAGGDHDAGPAAPGRGHDDHHHHDPPARLILSTGRPIPTSSSTGPASARRSGVSRRTTWP